MMELRKYGRFSLHMAGIYATGVLEKKKKVFMGLLA